MVNFLFSSLVAANQNYYTYVVVLKLKTRAPMKVLHRHPVEFVVGETGEAFVFGGRKRFYTVEFK